MGFPKWMGRSWRAGLLVAVGLAGGATAWAIAAVPDSGGVIHACVDLTTSGGTTVPDQSHPNVTIIDKDAGQQCIPPDPPVPNQTEITWNVMGPPGAGGPPGQPGQSNSYAVTIAPPTVRGRSAPIGHVTLGPGRGALQFDLLTYGFAPSGTSAAGAAGGKVNFNEFQIVKKTDKASPKLFKACANGQHFKSVTVVLRKKGGGGTKEPFLVVKLDQVIVTSFQAAPGGRGGSRPLESVTLNFTKSRLVYK